MLALEKLTKISFSPIDPVGGGGHRSLISNQTSGSGCVGVGALS